MWTWPTGEQIAKSALKQEIRRLLALLPEKQQEFFWSIAGSSVPAVFSFEHGDVGRLQIQLGLVQRSIDKYAAEAP